MLVMQTVDLTVCIFIYMIMAIFSPEIFLEILSYYEFNDFKELRKISMINRLFYRLVQMLVFRFTIISENNLCHNPTPQIKYKLARNGTEILLTEQRYINIESIYYNWKSLEHTKTSYGNGYYKAFKIIEHEYILPKNIFYNKYFKYLYCVAYNSSKFEVIHIISNRSFMIDNSKNGGLNFFKLGVLGEDWHHCHKLIFFFTEFLFKKLILMKYLKEKKKNVRKLYNELWQFG